MKTTNFRTVHTSLTPQQQTFFSGALQIFSLNFLLVTIYKVWVSFSILSICTSLKDQSQYLKDLQSQPVRHFGGLSFWQQFTPIFPFFKVHQWSLISFIFFRFTLISSTEFVWMFLTSSCNFLLHWHEFTLTQVQSRSVNQKRRSFNVQIFWEGHKNLAHLPLFIRH